MTGVQTCALPILIATADGGYESASDYDEETLALITREEHGS